jgi:CheY-like chemotaxis protein
MQGSALFTDPARLALRARTASRPILITDNEPATLELFQIALGGAGCTVLTAPSARAVLSIARSQPVSLITADMGSGNMDGIELLKSLRAEAQTSAIPFVFLTAYAPHLLHLPQIQELGCDAVVTKPVAILDFLSVIDDILLKHWDSA